VSNSSKASVGIPALTFGALGVVYGDIGTSPIYALKESLANAGTVQSEVFGVVSLLFWSLMIVVTIKYLLFVLRADNNGEGGILALFSLLPANIRRPSKRLNITIFALMLLGTALLFGDGLLTPAISVLSATEGLATLNPELGELAVPLTIAILIALFSFQYKGTESLGKVFGVVILIWFTVIGLLGLRAVLEVPSVVGALSPTYAIQFISSNGFHTFIIMSSVILAVTGAEALYADLGHFGVKPIRIGWFLIVGPCLVLNYLGQAARMMQNPENRENLFFSLAESSTEKVLLIAIATLATIIASQALISGVASLARQASQLGLFPRVNIVHTSENHAGQIYVPAINTILAIGSIFLVINFKTSSALAHAYSFAITGTMLITTIAFSIIALHRWKWNKLSVIAFVLIIGTLDAVFFLSSVTKILHGAWVPLLIAIGVVYLMWVWRKGQNVLSQNLRTKGKTWQWLEESVISGEVIETESLGIFLSASPDTVPQAAVAQVQNLQAIPHRMIITTVVTDDVPFSTRAPEIKQINNRAKLVTIYCGFMESPNIPKALISCCIDAEVEKSATYFLSDRKFVGLESGELQGNAEKVFSFLHRNSATAAHYYGLPQERVITLAVQMDL
jgi:KUP system potassium uptake protein